VFFFFPLSPPLQKIMTSRESSITDDSIDPALLWLEQQMDSGPNDCPPSQTDTGEAGGMVRIGDFDGNNGDEGNNYSTVPDSEMSMQLSSNGMVLSSIFKEVFRQLKRQKTFTPESEADLDVFASVGNHAYFVFYF
jgi:hypothetical protein